jgi:hypothetical protein
MNTTNTPHNFRVVVGPLIIVSRYETYLHGNINYLTSLYQIAKQIGKIQGERVFDGLLSVTNEFGEIRICDLVPTKAHSQFDIALSRWRDSLNTYGLEHPSVFFTDALSDQPMLERHFPSLTKDVIPISDTGDLPSFVVPVDVHVSVHRTATEIGDIIGTLIDQLPDGEDLIVGLDAEWNVDLEARRRGIPDPKRVAILQLAHGKRVWIFQVIKIVYCVIEAYPCDGLDCALYTFW